MRTIPGLFEDSVKKIWRPSFFMGKENDPV